MAEIPGSNIEGLSLSQSEMVTLLNDHLWRLWCLQHGALDIANQPAGGESDGDMYIVGSVRAGDFAAAAFDPDDVAILNFLEPASTVSAGPGIIQSLRIYHDKAAGNFVEEILEALDKGKTVLRIAACKARLV